MHGSKLGHFSLVKAVGRGARVRPGFQALSLYYRFGQCCLGLRRVRVVCLRFGGFVGRAYGKHH